MPLTLSHLERHLFRAADILRAKMQEVAPQHRDPVILERPAIKGSSDCVDPLLMA